MNFLMANLGNIIVGAVVAAIVILAVRQMIRQRKSGGCAGCAAGGTSACHCHDHAHRS